MVQSRQRLASSQAVRRFDRAILLKPDYAEAHYNRAVTLADLKQLDQAIAGFSRAVAIAPNYTEAYFNRGNALAGLGRQADALADFDRAIAVKPDYLAAYNNRGTTLRELKRLDEALAAFESAAALAPASAEAKLNIAIVSLMRGDLARGWRLYETRWQSAAHDTPARNFPQPL